MERILKLENVTKKFGGLTAVSDLTIHLNKGEILGLIGPNGAGKTTTFNLISGTLPVTEGDIIFQNDKITGLSPDEVTNTGIARTFQNIRLMDGLTVAENMRAAFHIREDYSIFDMIFRTDKFTSTEFEYNKEIDKMMGNFNIIEYRDHVVDDLAPGIQRKVDIARALIMKPEIALLDEPTAGMNPAETNELVEIIKWVRNELGISIILVEHDMRVIMGICDRIVVIDQGNQIAQGSAAEIQNNDRVIKAYLGTEYTA